MLRHLSLIVASVIAFPCVAATTSWEAFDLANCKHWMMTPDDFEGRGENFERAKELAEELNAKNKDNHWLVVEGGVMLEEGDDLYGVCSFQHSWSVLTCAKGIDFPLSGATYRKMGPGITLETYKCIQGCDATEVQMIHDMGYETEDSNVEHVKLQAKFERKCHEKEKRKKASDEYNKRLVEDLNKKLLEDSRKRHQLIYGF